MHTPSSNNSDFVLLSDGHTSNSPAKLDLLFSTIFSQGSRSLQKFAQILHFVGAICILGTSLCHPIRKMVDLIPVCCITQH